MQQSADSEDYRRWLLIFLLIHIFALVIDQLIENTRIKESDSAKICNKITLLWRKLGLVDLIILKRRKNRKVYNKIKKLGLLMRHVKFHISFEDREKLLARR